MKKLSLIILGFPFIFILFIQACKNDGPTTPPGTPTPTPIPACVLGGPTCTPTPHATVCFYAGPHSSISTLSTPVPLSQNDYVSYTDGFISDAFPNETSILSLDSITFFAINTSHFYPAKVELAVFWNNGIMPQEILADKTYTIPRNVSGWFTTNLSGAVTNVGNFNLVVHALSPGISIGTVQSEFPCHNSSGSYSGFPLPASILFDESDSHCYAIGTFWCERDLYNGF